MRVVVAAALLCASVSWASERSWAPTRNDLGITNHVEEVKTTTDVINFLNNPFFMPRAPGAEELVIIEQIINLGEKLWKIVERNKPVVNVKYTYANAVPKGVKTTEELDGFSSAQAATYRMHGTNLFGATVYDVTYTVVHRYGGQYKGKGQYLDAVTVYPHKLDVLWGYTVNFNVDRISTVNVGSAEAPVASILMDLNFSVSTVLKTSQFRQIYEFRGDSESVRAVAQ
jgi:hypothetical protein